ncbi:MAG: hypothetical protein RID07_15840, partial [Lacipirellulaceae bacterium]
MAGLRVLGVLNDLRTNLRACRAAVIVGAGLVVSSASKKSQSKFNFVGLVLIDPGSLVKVRTN